MKGIIYLKSGTYVFRNDHGHGNEIWAWNTHDSYDRAKVHKWNKLPKGYIEFFDIERPPKTVTYIPILL